jgi:hypothetical protein
MSEHFITFGFVNVSGSRSYLSFVASRGGLKRTEFCISIRLQRQVNRLSNYSRRRQRWPAGRRRRGISFSLWLGLVDSSLSPIGSLTVYISQVPCKCFLSGQPHFTTWSVHDDLSTAKFGTNQCDWRHRTWVNSLTLKHFVVSSCSAPLSTLLTFKIHWTSAFILNRLQMKAD